MTAATDVPRVSVIMPFFNAERFLAEAVESVRAQTYPHWELLLIDDGSTDGSTAEAKQFAAADPVRIRYLTHPGRENRGASAARNLGIAEARGEYLALLDSDDVWLPHKLAEQVPLLDRHPQAGAVIGPAFWWYSWTGEAEDHQRDRLDPVGFAPGTVIPPPELLRRVLLEAVPAPLPSIMLLRKAAADSVGGFEESFRIVFTDQAFFTKLLLTTPVIAADRVWARYRRHADSSVAKVAREGNAHAAVMQYLGWADEYLDSAGMRGTPVWRALQRRLWRHRNPRLARYVGRAKHAVRGAIATLGKGH